MNRARVARISCVLCSTLMVASAIGGPPRFSPSSGAEAELLRQSPQARVYREGGGTISRVYGAPLATGPSALAAAERFRQERSMLFCVPASDIVAGRLHPDGLRELPLMLDRGSGNYRFTGVFYYQVKDDLPVEGSGMIALVRNEPANPVVLVSAQLFELGGFAASAQAKAAGFDAAARSGRLAFGSAARLGEPRKVVWAGTDAEPDQPAVAWRFEVERGEWGSAEHERWLVIADALSGRILHQQSLIEHADVNGHVLGLATQGATADICEREVPTPLPHLRINLGATSVYADALGQFSMPTCCATPVTLDAMVRGRYFRVANLGAPDSSLQVTATPPGPADLLFNPLNEELTRAEVNVYVQANLARDYLLEHVPNYPGIVTQQDYEVRVNSSGECDAFWGGPYIVFPRSSLPGSPNQCPNMANSTLVHHEYGHQITFAGSGTGSGSYGEGMADTVALLVTDQPEMSLGHFGDCRESIRSAINDRQYPCCCEPHFCGQILSGSVWDSRTELASTNPSTYRQIISELIFSSIMLHIGQSITPGITVDVLTLDDDDAFLGNGTPHYAEIATGFGNHNMDVPPLIYLDYSFPDGLPDFVSPEGGDTVSIQYTPVIDTLAPGSVQFFVDVGGGFAPAAVSQVGAGLYRGIFPPSACGLTVRYYFAAQTSGGVSVLVPASAPGVALEALSSTGRGDVIFADPMESGQGGWLSTWDMPLAGGFWNVVQPLGTVFEGHQAAPPEDSSPAPGTKCWVTQQGTGGSAEQADVDGGPVHLTSPILDLAGQDAMVSCDVWFFSSGAGDAADFLTIQLSNDDGQSWTPVRSIAGTNGKWQTERFFVGRYVAPNSTVRLRFSTSDAIGGSGASIVEAGVDEVHVVRFACPAAAPADLNHDGSVNGLDLALLLGMWGPCPAGGGACPADLDGSGAVNGLDLAMLLAAWTG